MGAVHSDQLNHEPAACSDEGAKRPERSGNDTGGLPRRESEANGVGLRRIELRTSALSVLRSNRLSYSPNYQASEPEGFGPSDRNRESASGLSDLTLISIGGHGPRLPTPPP
jgi:hypothetical protein